MMQHDAPRAATPINRPVALYAEALALWDAGRAQDAADRLDEALRLQPNFAEALSMGGYILERGGKAETAVRFYKRALECKASPADHLVQSGQARLPARPIRGSAFRVRRRAAPAPFRRGPA